MDLRVHGEKQLARWLRNESGTALVKLQGGVALFGPPLLRDSGFSPEEIVRVVLKIPHQRNIYILCGYLSLV